MAPQREPDAERTRPVNPGGPSESGQNGGADHLDDLRAQLPTEFRGAPDAEVALLWVAWDAARRGHPVTYLIDTLAVPEELAHRLVADVNAAPRRD
jgi:hypothetical protein